jgi:hypothetical protein
MKTETKIIVLALVAIAGIVIVHKIATHGKNATTQGATGGTAPALQMSPDSDPITEAAYFQGASEFAAATGPNEGQDGEEVTFLT